KYRMPPSRSWSLTVMFLASKSLGLISGFVDSADTSNSDSRPSSSRASIARKSSSLSRGVVSSISRSITLPREVQDEIALADAERVVAQRPAIEGGCEVLLADPRQNGVGEDGVDHPPPALDLGAARPHEPHRRIVVGEAHLVVVGDAPG